MLVSEKLMILISFLLSMSLNCSYIIYSHCLKFEEKVIKSDEVDTQINTMILWRENKQWIQWRSSANKQQQLHGFVKSHHWSAFQSKKKLLHSIASRYENKQWQKTKVDFYWSLTQIPMKIANLYRIEYFHFWMFLHTSRKNISLLLLFYLFLFI